MNILRKKILPISLFFLLSGNSMQTFGAESAVNINLSGMYFAFSRDDQASVDESSDVSTNKSLETHYTYTSIGICYEIAGICLGGKLIENSREETITEKTSEKDSKIVTTATWNGIGATLGLLLNGFYFNGNYYFSYDKTLTSEFHSDEIEEKYMGWQGWSADLGYFFDAKKLLLGPQISLFHFEFSKKKPRGGEEVKLESMETDNQIIPQIVLGVRFK